MGEGGGRGRERERERHLFLKSHGYLHRGRTSFPTNRTARFCRKAEVVVGGGGGGVRETQVCQGYVHRDGTSFPNNRPASR